VPVLAVSTDEGTSFASVTFTESPAPPREAVVTRFGRTIRWEASSEVEHEVKTCLNPCQDDSERFWLDLQTGHDMDVERGRPGDRLESEALQYMG